MANGDYKTQKVKETPKGLITIPVYATVNQQQDAMKLVRKFKEFFVSIFKNYPETFIKMTETLQKVKNEETGTEAIALVK